MSEYLSTAQDAARMAGHYLKKNFGAQIAVESKESHHSIVTLYDVEAESLIIDFIKTKFPTHGFLSEEIGLIHGEAEYIWVIDPLDGSSYYARGVETFSVSIALMYQYEVIAGAIYLPIQDELFFAEKDKGAFINEKKIAVSRTKDLAQSMGNFGHRYLRLEEYDEGMRKLLKSIRSVRGGGSCAMEMAYLACGRIDMVLTVNQSFWDYAAGSLIVAEAGGEVTDTHGNQVNAQEYLMKKYDLLATNGHLHKNVLGLIKCY